jgi:hypothetical protein
MSYLALSDKLNNRQGVYLNSISIHKSIWKEKMCNHAITDNLIKNQAGLPQLYIKLQGITNGVNRHHAILILYKHAISSM